MSGLMPYPRFSLAERDRRWRAVRSHMRAQNIDVIVLPNNTGHSADLQSNSRYLSGVGGGGDADICVIFPLEGEITAIATSAAPRWPMVQEWTKDIREARRRFGRAAVARLKELKVEKGRIGIAGLGEGTRTPEGTVPLSMWNNIREGFPHAEIVDATAILRDVRYIKSAEEIEALTKSIEIVEHGVAAEVAAAKAGASDWQVWASAIGAMLYNGSEMPVHCNWISGKNPVRTMTRPSFRILERGDLIINELEASWIGYRAQAVQPVFVEVIDPVHVELFKIQYELFNEMLPHMRPGVTVRELSERAESASNRAIPKHGPFANAKTRLTMHGRGAGDDGPIITDHARDPAQLAVALQENMVFIFKPSARTHDESSICTWGDTVVITPQGARRLGQRAHALAVSS
jgi:Xaa-Pro dipeptidase